MVEYFVLMFSFYYSNACLRFTRYNEHYILQNQSGGGGGEIGVYVLLLNFSVKKQ